jgi:exopolysaccharide biosynthesis protein
MFSHLCYTIEFFQLANNLKQENLSRLKVNIMKIHKFILITSIIVTLFKTTGCTSINNSKKLSDLGLEYQYIEIQKQRINRAHILRVDLKNPNIKPSIILAKDPDGSGPAEAELTNPFELANKNEVLAFINTNPWDSFPNKEGKRNRNWFEGQPVDIDGLAISGGKIRSNTQPRESSLWLNNKGQLILGGKPENEESQEAMNGFQLITKEGNIIVSPDNSIHPRTAIGTNKNGTLIWLVVVDGRQKGYSEGMNLYELASLMADLGCWNATNMDGGGSSIMGMVGANGKIKLMNSPSDRFLGLKKIRPLPMILSIEKKVN